MKKAILMVHFGTSHPDTRKKTLDAINDSVRKNCIDAAVYEAYLSPRIRNAVSEREGIVIPSTEEMLAQLLSMGYEEVILQPSLMLNGVEYEHLMKIAEEYRKSFHAMKIGKPVLTEDADFEELIRICDETYDFGRHKDRNFVLVGHGSKGHEADAVYRKLDRMLKEKGFGNVCVGTIEGCPCFDEVVCDLLHTESRKACLIPLMIVAGEHAKKDMDGEGDSWKALLAGKGITAETVLCGLGELCGVQELILEHLLKAE